MAYRSKSLGLMLAGGGVVLLLIMLVATTMGPASIGLEESFQLVVSMLPGLGGIVDTSRFPSTHEVIVVELRAPRVILAALVGSALAVVGTTFQGLFKNPMADPYIIGVSSGAALGAAVAIVLGASSVIGYWALPGAAFLGAIISTWLVYSIARVGGRVPVYTLLLSGVALSAFSSALMSLVMILNASEMRQIVFWMLGSFSGRGWPYVQVALPFILTGICGLWFFARDLNAMLFGEDTARHLGVNTERLKRILLILSALTVASAVAVSGTIGFVGLIIPHIARLVVGPDHRVLIPVAALTGASFMVATDTLARTVMAPIEIPVGIITAFFGGPFFIYLLKRKKTGAL